MDNNLEQQIKAQGMDPQTAEQQLNNFKNGFPFLEITAPATPNNGIKVLTEEELNHYSATYPEKASRIDIVKFVPASGAASRMFKDLYAFLESDGDLSQHPFVKKFINNIEKFAFYDDLNKVLAEKNNSVEQCIDTKNYKELVASLLQEPGLGYGNLPKGLLRFHAYEDGQRTPAHEHLVEGVEYALGRGKVVQVHFTVSPEHESKFKHEISSILPSLEKKYEAKFEITYSQQKKSTDTISVTMDNTPFLEDDGSILFRPAGHGALLENLNEISADLIFIKNIDNVVPDRLKEETINYKMAIGGLLLDVQQQVFDAIRGIVDNLSNQAVDHAEKVFVEILGGKLPDNFSTTSYETKASILKEKLNRPIRVCGMVKNTGEPGGGPFWVKETDGSQSLQILETAQIDLENPASKQHFNAATHFNPVDLVCGTKDYRGDSFDLLKYRDMNTGFITNKSKNGRELKALELPGLWNGAMAGWNTLFVEVPLITFNPVKTVNDLLREEHQ